jgi:predicted ester cyclase
LILDQPHFIRRTVHPKNQDGGEMYRLKQVFAVVLFVVAAAAVSCQDAAPDVSARNAALIRAHHDLLNQGDWKTASTYFSEDTKNFGHPVGRDHVALILQDIWTTFPDLRMEIVDLVAKDDWVVVRCRTSGTHLGVGKLPVNGGLLVGVAPTHKHFEVDTVHWYTLRDGKIVDHRGVRDDLGMMEQLGLLAGPKN